VTIHTYDTLRSARILAVVDDGFAIPTLEAPDTECLIAGENDEIFDFCAAVGAVVGTIVAEEGSITEQEETGVGVKECATTATSKAVNVPP
jgi:hypothetical protein